MDKQTEKRVEECRNHIAMQVSIQPSNVKPVTVTTTTIKPILTYIQITIRKRFTLNVYYSLISSHTSYQLNEFDDLHRTLYVSFLLSKRTVTSCDCFCST